MESCAVWNASSNQRTVPMFRALNVLWSSCSRWCSCFLFEGARFESWLGDRFPCEVSFLSFPGLSRRFLGQ